MKPHIKMLLGGLATATALALLRLHPRMGISSYTECCRYLAILDEEIARRLLEGQSVGGKAIVFPTRRASLAYRYSLHLGLHRHDTKAQLEREIRRYEQRLVRLQQQAADAV